jgi:hypothetical protein
LLLLAQLYKAGQNLVARIVTPCRQKVPSYFCLDVIAIEIKAKVTRYLFAFSIGDCLRRVLYLRTMNLILEIDYAPETGRLEYRFGDKFSSPRSLEQKESDTELYGEGYYYRNVAREFGITDEEEIKVVSPQGKLLWSS